MHVKCTFTVDVKSSRILFILKIFHLFFGNHNRNRFSYCCEAKNCIIDFVYRYESWDSLRRERLFSYFVDRISYHINVLKISQINFEFFFCENFEFWPHAMITKLYWSCCIYEFHQIITHLNYSTVRYLIIFR